MSQNNLLQGYNWDSQYEDAPLSRPLQDEVISVYEVYVKEEETSGSDGRSNNGSVVSGSTSGESSTANEHRLLIQDDSTDLDAEIDSEIINVDGTMTKLVGEDSLKYKMVEQSVINSVDEAGMVVYPNNQTISEQNGNSSSTGPHLIDKDDPRSRLHFVKYLKRDGKTLKIWECGICTKEFRHQYTLMRHLPTHTDERNFKCDACGKAFRQLSTLSQHKAIHSDARPYVCEFCKKTFNRVSTLISHRKTHSEHKPHKCHVCGKGFHQKGNLRNHVFTHTNERPYKCELCSKGFNQMSNLVCHKIKAHAHTEKGQYSCGLCGKEFPRRFALRSHEEYKHGIKYRNPGGISREQKLAGASKNSTSTSTSAAVSNTSSTCTSSIPSTTISNTAIITPGGSATSNGPNVIRNKSVRIVEMPNGERNDGLVKIDENETEYTDSIVVDRIDTKALENAIIQGQTPFALLKPVKGIPVLVKVLSAGPHKHLLTPANPDDLRTIGKISLSPTITSDPEGFKALQIKIPVVATITQHLDEDGKQSFTIEPPGPDQDLESLVAPLDSNCPYQDNDSSLRLHSGNSTSVYECRNSLKFDGNTTTTTTVEGNYQSDECSELLELAAQGGIQFVRATEDGRYEVMSNSEARELMSQNCHDVTILDGEDADALNIVDSRINETTNFNHEDLMIDDPDSQIMVLDSLTSAQKSIGLEGIEIFEDKDIRILDPKNLDDRVLDGMTFLSQMKIDDLILVPGKSTNDQRSIENVAGCTISIGSPVARELSGIFGQRNEILNNNFTGQQTINMNSLIGKSQAQQQSIINETMNYLRNCPARSLTEELNLSNEENEAGTSFSENQRHQHYSGKVRFNDFVETNETDEASNILSIGHQRGLVNCSRISDYHRVNETRNYWDKQRNIPSFGEVKILGPKINNQDSLENGGIKSHKDIRILGSYEQYLNSSAFGQSQQFSKNHYVDETLPVGGGGRKEVKILGKKLECGFFENDEDGKLVKIEEETDKRREMVSDAFEECWNETNRSNDRYNNESKYDEENDITYANIVDS